MKVNILTALELLNNAGTPRGWTNRALYERYHKIAKEHFRERKKVVRDYDGRIENLEAELQEAEAAVAAELQGWQEVLVEEASNPEDVRAPLFSKMTDKDGYYAQVLLEGRIEQLLMTDYLHQ